jgi:hypothetical protein
MGILVASAAALVIPAGAGARTPVPVTPVTPVPVAPVTHVQVSPAPIFPRTNVVIRFLQPQTTGETGSEQTVESLRVIGPTRAGCVESDAIELTSADAGTMMRRTLRPARLGGSWCTGIYRGELMIATEPGCFGGPIHAVSGEFVACPMFFMLPRTVATFSFRVVAS